MFNRVMYDMERELSKLRSIRSDRESDLWKALMSGRRFDDKIYKTTSDKLVGDYAGQE